METSGLSSLPVSAAVATPAAATPATTAAAAVPRTIFVRRFMTVSSQDGSVFVPHMLPRNAEPPLTDSASDQVRRVIMGVRVREADADEAAGRRGRRQDRRGAAARPDR